MSFAFGVHLNFLSVRPRVWRTDFTQIAMAARSFAAALRFWPFRNFTVRRTFPTHLQKSAARVIYFSFYKITYL